MDDRTRAEAGRKKDATTNSWHKQGLGEHAAPFDALVTGIESSADIQVGGVGHRLAEGEALLMPPNVPHAVLPAVPFKMLLVTSRGERAVQTLC